MTVLPVPAGRRIARLLPLLQDALADRAVVAVRRALAAGRERDAVAVLAFAVRQTHVSATDAELDQLDRCLREVGLDASWLADAPLGVRLPVHRLEPGDRTEDDDRAVVDALRGLSGVLGAVRARRTPDTSASWPPPRLVYLVETADDAARDTVLARCYGGSPPTGAPEVPLVDAYAVGEELAPQQRRLRDVGVLVQVGIDVPQFAFADLFDGGPGPDGLPQDLVRVDASEAAGLQLRLDAGRRVVVLEDLGDDLLDPGRGAVVPRHLRTDGRWIWSDATAYYLREHAVAPVAALRDHLNAQQDAPAARPVPDVVTRLAREWLRYAGIA